MPDLETFGAYADAWLARRAPQFSRRTQQLYRWELDTYLRPTLGDVGLLTITRGLVHQVATVLELRGLARATVHHAIALAARILTDAVDAEVLAYNPATHVLRRLPHERHQAAVYAPTELVSFLAAARTTTLYPCFAAMAGAGLRVGEAMGLQVGDAELTTQRLRVDRTMLRDGTHDLPKSKQRRVVDMTASCTAALGIAIARAQSAWLFPGRFGGTIAYETIRATMDDVAARAGLPRRTPHALRHTYASLLIARGVPIAYVQRQLGHASIAITVDLYGSHLPFPRPADLDVL